jgi:anti-anti-sigma factor
MVDPTNLQVTVEEQGRVRLIAARGDVDLATTPTLRDAMESSCVAQGDTTIVAVDLRQADFIDSAGLALLVEMRKRFLQSCELALVIKTGSQPERVLKLGRFDTFLRICYSPDELHAAEPTGAG